MSGLFRDNVSGQFALVNDSAKKPTDLGVLNVKKLYASNGIEVFNPTGEPTIACDNRAKDSIFSLSVGDKVNMTSNRDICINNLLLHEDEKNITIGGKSIIFSSSTNLWEKINEEKNERIKLNNLLNEKVLNLERENFDLNTRLEICEKTKPGEKNNSDIAQLIQRVDEYEKKILENGEKNIENMIQRVSDCEKKISESITKNNIEKSNTESVVKKIGDCEKKISELITKNNTQKSDTDLIQRISNCENKIGTISKNMQNIENNVTNCEKKISEMIIPKNNKCVNPQETSNINDGWIKIHSPIIILQGNTIGKKSELHFIKGMKIKINQKGEEKYFIVSDIDDAFVTLYGGNKYNFTGEKIENAWYSYMKAPFGFELDPLIWTKNFTITLDTLPVKKGEFKTIGTINVPIGSWNLSYTIYIRGNKEQTILSTLSINETAETIQNSTDIEYGYKLIKLNARNNVTFKFEQKLYLLIKSDEDDILSFKGYDIKIHMISNYL